MSNPNVFQGNLNRLLAQVQIQNFPGLTVTVPYLAKEAISIAFEGPVTSMPETLTGTVTSPEPYQMAVVTINLVKTAGNLANAYKAQLEQNSQLGPITVYPDNTSMSPWNITNCSIAAVEPVDMGGLSPRYTVVIRGTYQINNSLWP